MSGVPGAGKSTIAREISRRIEAIVIDNDICRSIALEYGVESNTAGQVAYETMFALAHSFLTQGFSVILDSPCRFQMILDKGLQIAAETEAAYRCIECVTEDLAIIRHRLQRRTPLRSQFTAIDNLPAVVENGIESLSGEARFRYWMATMKRPDRHYLRLDTSQPVEVCIRESMAFLKACEEPEMPITPIESTDSDRVASEMTKEEIQATIERYEQQFNITSAELVEQIQNGTAPDLFEIMNWYLLLRHQ